MGLADLTDREAVLAAIHEFDEVGRDEFLSKYGFVQARSYFLKHEGDAYDSKAIAGVAYGKQFPGGRGRWRASKRSSRSRRT